MSNVSSLAEYIPDAWRAYQHLGEIRSLQERAQPHIQALMMLMPEAQALYAQIFPELVKVSSHPPPAQGITVRQLQEMLNHYGANLTVDGVYGKATHEAVEAYQRGNGLVPDGWAGSKTLDHLFHKVSTEAAA